MASRTGLVWCYCDLINNSKTVWNNRKMLIETQGKFYSNPTYFRCPAEAQLSFFLLSVGRTVVKCICECNQSGRRVFFYSETVAMSTTFSGCTGVDGVSFAAQGLCKAWSPHSRNNRRTCFRRCSEEDVKAINISIAHIYCEIWIPANIRTMWRPRHTWKA